MTKRLLIDATHAEETRVIIADGTRIEEYETETQGKAQLKGNIYIGHVSRVEPSLQAAFITYGGNRNGFLAFAEVNPMFFHLPKAEKAELLENLAAHATRRRAQDVAATDDTTPESDTPEATTPAEQPNELFENAGLEETEINGNVTPTEDTKPTRGGARGRPARPQREFTRARPVRAGSTPEATSMTEESTPTDRSAKPQRGRGPSREGARSEGRTPKADAPTEALPHLPVIHAHRKYRIQDVLKEGQKILVQVVKEERGSKGAALTTFFSLAGRYTVLMPNTPAAGGISRKITDPEERRTLRNAYAALDVPPTMGLIIRTAGVSQPIDVIKTDYTNLTNLWQGISQAFEKEDDIQCVHEDGSVIVRALRDMAVDELDEIVISGKRAYKVAKDYCKTLMPEAAKLIKEHKEDTPIFTHYKLEAKLHQLHHTRVQLPSGGYLIINPTEALVSVDINSGRATQERNIEETATKTNLEACDELARQIRLRDLAGLIVVDFIDMEDNRNVRKVEGAMRKALRRDRARIQCGNISQFGLMEISRQRLRPSLAESHFITCPHCNGSGQVHSPGTAALMILRRLEEEDCTSADRIVVSTSTAQILWLLNHKRDLVRDIETKHKFQLLFRADDTLHAPDHKLELVRLKADGTEVASTISVVLREQPELPPEQRYTPSGRRRDEGMSAAPAPREREKEERDDKPTKRESAKHPDEGRGPSKKIDSRPARNEPRPARNERPARPQPAASAPAAAPQPTASSAPAPRAPRPAVQVADAPLAVQKVTASTDPTPIITPSQRAPMVIKKQADTDRTDTPLAVVKQSEPKPKTEPKPKADPKPAPHPDESRGPAAKPGSILARLIGRT